MHVHRLTFAAALCGALLAMQTVATAQTTRPDDAQPASRPAFPGGRGFGGFGPRADPLQPIKPKIAASDEEWKVIGPLLRKVAAARADLRASVDPANENNEPGAGGPGGGANAGANAGGGPPGGFDRVRGGPGFGRSSFDGPGGGPGPGGGGPGGGGPGGGPGGRFPFGGPPGGGFPGEFPPGGFGPDGSRPSTQPTSRPAGENARGNGPGDVVIRLEGGGPPRGGGGGGFGGLFGVPGGGSPVAIALRELHAAIADHSTPPETLTEKVAAVRKARRKAAAELETAQRELLELLTSDQEAVLVSLGYLD